jgi:hypothetical protein
MGTQYITFVYFEHTHVLRKQDVVHDFRPEIFYVQK